MGVAEYDEMGGAKTEIESGVEWREVKMAMCELCTYSFCYTTCRYATSRRRFIESVKRGWNFRSL